jgi:hypothetical protein
VADVVYTEKVGDEKVEGGGQVGDDAVVYGVEVFDVEGVEGEREKEKGKRPGVVAHESQLMEVNAISRHRSSARGFCNW